MIHILFHARHAQLAKITPSQTNEFDIKAYPIDACRSYVALPCALEEEPDNKDLKSAHADDQQDLNQAEVDDPFLCAADGAEVAVLAGAKVFLIPGDGRHLARDLEERLFERRRLFRGSALLGREGHAGLVLDLEDWRSVRGKRVVQADRAWAYRNLKVDKLVGVGAHLVVEAELVLAGFLRSEDKVSLPLLLPIHDVPPIRTRDPEVDVEGAA